MPLTIRRALPEDYPAIAAIGAAAMPTFSATAESLQARDGSIEPPCVALRYVAELDGAVAGTAFFHQVPSQYTPGRYYISGFVRPDLQGRGIGSALFDHGLALARERQATSLKLWTREDLPHAIRFLENRGCVEFERHFTSFLDVATFDFGPYIGLEEKIAASGIHFLTLTEWRAYPDWARRLWALHTELVGQIPEPDLRPDSWEEFQAGTLEDPTLLPEAHWVALHGDELIGTSSLWQTADPAKLYTKLTGVRQAYRHRGIALAMKLKGIAYAREHGCTRLETSNAMVNRPMLRINEQLGFSKEPGWVAFNYFLHP